MRVVRSSTIMSDLGGLTPLSGRHDVRSRDDDGLCWNRISAAHAVTKGLGSNKVDLDASGVARRVVIAVERE